MTFQAITEEESMPLRLYLRRGDLSEEIRWSLCYTQ